MDRRSRLSRALAPWIALSLLLVCAPPFFLTAQAQESIAGDYAVSIPKDAAPKDLPNSSMIVGSWHIQFADDGTYLAERIDLGPLVTGTWELEGDTLTITDQAGDLACTQAAVTGDASLDFSTGTYTVEFLDEGLTLEPLDDGCRLRTVLLGANELGPYVGCPIPPAGVAAATPEAEADAAAAPSGDTEEQIDTFLAQLTACWLTGDADRFLQLLTPDYRDEFLTSGIEDAENPSQQSRALASAMGVPLIFERAGDVRQVREGEVTCIVRTELAGQESFARFRFILQEDGNWRWDGPA